MQKLCPYTQVCANLQVLTASHCVLNGDETEIISARASQTVYFGCENLSEKSCQQRTVVEIRQGIRRAVLLL
jgi:hypothetical protein